MSSYNLPVLASSNKNFVILVNFKMEQTGFTQGSDANTTTQQTPFVLTEKHIEFLTSIEEWLENDDEMLSLIYDGSVAEDGDEELDEEALARLEQQYGFVRNLFP